VPKFFASEETETLDLGDGFWVELKKELDYGEESELEGAAIKAGLNGDGTPKLEFSLKQQRNLLLGLYITDWNLPGPNGKPVQLPNNFERRVTLSLAGVEGAEENPTGPGDGSASETPSSSADGGAASRTAKSSARRIA
jgi:hypothetical protein